MPPPLSTIGATLKAESLSDWPSLSLAFSSAPSSGSISAVPRFWWESSGWLPASLTGRFAPAVFVPNWSPLRFLRTSHDRPSVSYRESVKIRAENSWWLRPLHQNQVAAQRTQLLLNHFVETGVAYDGIDL